MISRSQIEEIMLRNLGNGTQAGKDIDTLLQYIEEQDRFIRAGVAVESNVVTVKPAQMKTRKRRKPYSKVKL